MAVCIFSICAKSVMYKYTFNELDLTFILMTPNPVNRHHWNSKPTAVFF